MDMHTATEEAYKRGFEAGKKAAVRQGRWVLMQNKIGGLIELYECSECKIGFATSTLDHYCHNCGAKMDGGKGQNE